MIIVEGIHWQIRIILKSIIDRLTISNSLKTAFIQHSDSFYQNLCANLGSAILNLRTVGDPLL